MSIRFRKPRIFAFRQPTPRFILATGLLLTLACSGYVYKSIHRQFEIRFNAQTNDHANRVRHRLERYQNALIQTRSLFMLRFDVDRATFRDYVNGMGLFEAYPGIQGLGFALRVPRNRLDAHTASIRKEGFPEYRVWPREPVRGDYYPIVFLEPFDWRNQRAFGFDMTSEPIRAEAMSRARDTGQPAMSGKVKLVQETETDAQPGFLLYEPVYERGKPVETIEQRRAALRGYVYSPYRAVDFFEALFARNPSSETQIDFEVFSGTGAHSDAKIYDHDGHVKPAPGPWDFFRFQREIDVEFRGAHWTIAFRSLPDFVPGVQHFAPLAMLALGTLLSWVFYSIAKSTHDRSDRERRLTQELLLKSEALEHSLNGFDIVDENGRFIYVNHAYARMWGYDSAEEILGTSPVHHCADPELPGKIIRSLKETGRCEIEFLAKRKDGTTFDVRMWARRALDSHGREIYPTTSIDITEEKRAAEDRNRALAVIAKVNEAGKRITAELEREKLAQAVTDVATQLSGARFGAFFYNVGDDPAKPRTLYVVSGVPKESFSKFPLPSNTAVFHPTFTHVATVRSDDIRKDPRYGKNPEFKGIPEGHLPVASYLAVPVVSRKGEVWGGLFFGHEKPGVFTEESERIVQGLASQAAIGMDNAQLYRRLQETLRARDEFLSIASHELKTPITSLKLQFQMSQRQLDLGNTGLFTLERIKKMVENSNRQLDRMAGLIEDMLDISRIARGKLALNIEPVEVGALVHEALDRFSEHFREAGIPVRQDIPTSDAQVEVDHYRLEQVLDNLFSNAVKYGEGRPVDVGVRIHSDHAEILIQDQGMGIAPVDSERIFNRFERAVTPANISGLGIGLYISKQIVEAHRGRIRVESELGKGSTFIVDLPLKKGA